MLQICRSLLNFGLNLVIYRSLKGKTIGLGKNIFYETWQLQYFEGNQNLESILQSLQTEFNSPTLYFRPTSGLEIHSLMISWHQIVGIWHLIVEIHMCQLHFLTVGLVIGLRFSHIFSMETLGNKLGLKCSKSKLKVWKEGILSSWWVLINMPWRGAESPMVPKS